MEGWIDMTREQKFKKVDDRIHEFWDKEERKFALYTLLKDHKENLDRIIKGSPEPKDTKDAYAMQMMVNHKRIAEEMIYVLTAELF